MAKPQVTDIHRAISSGEEWLNTKRSLTSDDLKGRVILLDFWTYCCINCIHVIPDLQYIEHKFGNKLTVIGVHSAKFANEKDQENIRNAILRYDIKHPVVNDDDFGIWKNFGISAWPSFVLINPNGEIEQTYSGEGHREDFEEDIQNLINEYQDMLVTSPLPIELEIDKAPKTVLNYPGKIEHIADFDGKPALFISDSSNDRILGVRLNGQIFIEIGEKAAGNKDGGFKDAQFNTPQGILYHDGILYVADTNNHSLRKIDFSTKQVSTIAGTGKQGYDRSVTNENALETSLASPWDLEFYPDKEHIAVAMAGTHQLWTYNIAEKTVSVLAGNGRESIDDGELPHNSLSQPSGLSAYEGKLYFVDSETSSLRYIEENNVTTLIGTGLFDFGFVDGGQGSALLQHPLGVFANDEGVFITDSYNHSIRQYDYDTKQISTLYGNGKRGELNEPNDIIFVNDKFYIADTNNSQIKILDIKTKQLSSLNVMPEPQETKLTNLLPNLVGGGQLKISSKSEIQVNINWPDGWKLNDLAPSWLALFESNNGNLVKEYKYEDIKDGNAIIAKLNDNKKYILQGTLYYCEDKAGSICLLQSYDANLLPGPHAVNTIEIDLEKKQ